MIYAKIQGEEILLADYRGKPLGKPEILEQSDKILHWYFPNAELLVKAHVDNHKLHVVFSTTKEQTLEWPCCGRDPLATALILPSGEGLYIPLQDPFWQTQLQLNEEEMRAAAKLSMPFWGFQYGACFISYMLPDDLHNELSFQIYENKLSTVTRHSFRKRDNLPSYEVILSLCPPSPIGPALAYRELLISHDKHRSLSQKICENPEAGKLLGAFHAYLWGDGRTLEAIEDLQKLKIDRMWVGYDQNPLTHHICVTPSVVSYAKACGYLIGPYDTFDNIQDPTTADCISSMWDDELWPHGCIQNEDGSRKIGFEGRGGDLSSEALARLEPKKHLMAKRIQSWVDTGINSYFLDCDAGGELLDDFSPAHPMNKAQDRVNRLDRMSYITSQKKLVLGSESAAAWSTPVISFNHGTLSVFQAIFWPILRSEEFGQWWPSYRPDIFFKPYEAGDNFIKAKYDPFYRLPLYQTVFHDSVISTEHWTLSYMKIHNLLQVRALFELLYNVPSLWHLDRQELANQGKRMSELFQFFSPLHRVAGKEPLTHFEWLTPDHLVQKTYFGDVLEMVANFSDSPYEKIPPKSIQAHWVKEQLFQTFSPSE